MKVKVRLVSVTFRHGRRLMPIPSLSLAGMLALAMLNQLSALLDDLAKRIIGRIQLATDGHKAYYLQAVKDAFGANLDFVQLIKLYGTAGNIEDNRRYIPAECTGIEKRRIEGNPIWSWYQPAM